MWFLSPSGWPVYADSADEQDELSGRGYDVITEDQVQAAIDAFKAAEASPPSTQLPGWALASDVAAALALKANASSLAGKADRVGGKVPEAQLPDRLSDVELRAAFVAYDDVDPAPVTTAAVAARLQLTANQDGATGVAQVALNATIYAIGVTVDGTSLIVPQDGVYVVGGRAHIFATDAAERSVVIRVNGAAVLENNQQVAANAEARLGVTDSILLNAGDVLTLVVYGSGGTPYVIVGSSDPRETSLSMTLVGTA